MHPGNPFWHSYFMDFHVNRSIDRFIEFWSWELKMFLLRWNEPEEFELVLVCYYRKLKKACFWSWYRYYGYHFQGHHHEAFQSAHDGQHLGKTMEFEAKICTNRNKPNFLKYHCYHADSLHTFLLQGLFRQLSFSVFFTFLYIFLPS